MTTTPPITLDPREARRRRDIAIAQVEAGAEPDWLNAALWTVLHLCLTQPFFTPDDIWASGLPKPREPRALGPVMLRASRRGLCRKTGRLVQSEIPSKHQNPINEWRSLLFEGIEAPSFPVDQWDAMRYPVPPADEQLDFGI